MDGEVYVHTSSARGHFRANVEREPRVCFEIDAPEQVFDYGRFECDSGLAYQSVILFGRIRVIEDPAAKQRFCDTASVVQSLKNCQALFRKRSARRRRFGCGNDAV